MATRIRHLIIAASALSLGACTPYAVHTTAQPLPEGEGAATTIMTVVPNGAQFDSSRSGVAMPSLDLDIRRGVSDRSDVGVRINASSGIIMTVKHRLDGRSAKPGAATALLAGAGFVNLGQHAHFEATLIRSGDADRDLVPYGGVRVIQVVPMSSTAVHDDPAAGAFGGVRIGAGSLALGMELGVFYDRSALHLRRDNLLVVPSISITSRSRRERRGILDRTVKKPYGPAWPAPKPSIPFISRR
jgi:hypothetical protein